MTKAKVPAWKRANAAGRKWQRERVKAVRTVLAEPVLDDPKVALRVAGDLEKRATYMLRLIGAEPVGGRPLSSSVMVIADVLTAARDAAREHVALWRRSVRRKAARS